jgi:hypothetical protein
MELLPEPPAEERLMQVADRLAFDQRPVAHAVIPHVKVAPLDVDSEPFDEVWYPASAFVYVSDDRDRRQRHTSSIATFAPAPKVPLSALSQRERAA